MLKTGANGQQAEHFAHKNVKFKLTRPNKKQHTKKEKVN